MSSPALAAYRLATTWLAPAAPLLLRRRARRGREDPGRLAERLGHAGAARPPGRLAWLHGASVGESLSLLRLAERLRAARPQATVLVTSGTRAAAEVLLARLPAGALHQYAPIDTPAAARRFLAHWRPDLGVFAESELWPNLLLAARAGATRLALVGARQSPASLARWRRAPAAAKTLLEVFDLILARDEAAAAGLASLGAMVDGFADPKLAAAALPADQGELDRLAAPLAGRPVILAASTHPGEEAILLSAWAAVDTGESLLVIAPRHVDRGDAIADLARERGYPCRRRSAGDFPEHAGVYLADRLGELGLWYRLARLAILGGSLRPGVGGHNPLEPARLGCPVVSGRFVDNWPLIGGMAAVDALMFADGEAGLAAVIGRALCAPAALEPMARRAAAFAAAREEATLAALDQVVALLPA